MNVNQVPATPCAVETVHKSDNSSERELDTLLIDLVPSTSRNLLALLAQVAVNDPAQQAPVTVPATQPPVEDPRKQRRNKRLAAKSAAKGIAPDDSPAVAITGDEGRRRVKRPAKAIAAKVSPKDAAEGLAPDDSPADAITEGISRKRKQPANAIPAPKDTSKVRENVREKSGHFKRGSATHSQDVQDICITAGLRLGFPHLTKWYRNFQQEWTELAKQNGWPGSVQLPTYHQIYGWLTRHARIHEKSGIAPGAEVVGSPLQQAPPSAEQVVSATRPPPPLDIAAAPSRGDVAGSAVGGEQGREAGGDGDGAPTARASDDMLLDALAASELRDQRMGAARNPGMGISSTPPIPITSETFRKGSQIEVSNDHESAFGETGAAFFTANGIFGLHAIGKGGNGIVYRLLREGGDPSGIVVKASLRKYSYDSGLRKGGIEAAAMYTSSTLHNLRASKRTTHQPFAIKTSPMGGKTWLMWFPVTAVNSLGFTALFMQEGTPFGVEAERIAAEFTEPNGLVRENTFDRLAGMCETVLNCLDSANRIEIRHGDVKPDNLIMVPASSAPGCSFIRTEEGKMAILLADWGNAMFRDPHYVLPGHVDAYKSSISKPTALASKRAVGAMQNATSTNHVADEQSPGRGPQPYSLGALDAKYMCAPSSAGTAVGERPAAIHEFGGWGGTKGYLPPEVHHATSLPEFKGPHVCSRDFLPGDMWAFGIMAASIMSGKLSQSVLHPSDPNDKRSLCEAEMRCLWHKYLGKKARPPSLSDVPPEWEQALDFVQCILRREPLTRITPAEALQHPFLVDARKKVTKVSAHSIIRSA